MATPAAGSAAAVGGRGVVPRPVTGVGGLPLLWPLLCLEAAGGLVWCGVAAGGSVGWVLGALAAIPAALLLLGAVAWRRGESLPSWLGAVLALRRRRGRPVGAPPGCDPLFALAAECRPGLRSYAYTPPGGGEMGMAAHGGGLTAVLRVEAKRAPLQPGHDERPLPLALLYQALETDGIRLESVQSVQHTQPAPALILPERSVAGASYSLLQPRGAGGTPALRLTWVALRLDPELCPGAVAERGGGLLGAQRALARAAGQLASRLAGAGFTARVLTEAELLSAVAACTSSNALVTTQIGQQDGPRPRRTWEEARVWRCDDRWHTTYRVARWPGLGSAAMPLPALVALLTSVPAFATTFSLTLSGRGRDAVALSAHVRVTGRGWEELRAAGRRLQQAARSARVVLARMDRRQLAGLQATLPLGGEG